MVKDKYIGVWQRNWIDRHTIAPGASNSSAYTTRETTSAMWFQCRRFHIDMRINEALSSDPKIATEAQLSKQLAFAGETFLEQKEDQEVCLWQPSFSFPYPSVNEPIDEDCGITEFVNTDHLMEYALDDSYTESWQRANNIKLPTRGLRFCAPNREGKRQLECFVIQSGDKIAIASNRQIQQMEMPLFAWGELKLTTPLNELCEKGTSLWHVRQSITPQLANQTVELTSDLAKLLSMTDKEVAALIPTQLMWSLPFMHGASWKLIDFD